MAPDQQKAAERWASGAKDALDTAKTLFEHEKYQHALFFCHLAVEKALKSKYIAETNELPPYTHDIRLLVKHTDPKIGSEQEKEFAEINTFNIAGRYEDEKMDLHRKATVEYTQKWLSISEQLLRYIL